LNLALAIKNVINKFRNNGSDNPASNQSGIIVPEWLKNREISDNDPHVLKDFFNVFEIYYFSEITADYINNYGTKSYENVIKICNLLGLYGVIFLGRNSNKYSPNSSKQDLIVKSNDSLDSIYNLKLTNSHIDFVLNRENEIKILNFLKSENITTINQLNGLHLGVLSDKISIPLELVEKLFKNSGLVIIRDSEEELIDFYNEKNKDEYSDTVYATNTYNINSENYVDFYHLFSTRTENVLKSNGINTIEQLKNLTENQILSFKNAGIQTTREILEKINSKEINELYEEEMSLIKSNSSFDSELNSNKYQEKNYTIKELNLSTRTYNILKANNIINLNDLIQLNEAQILSFKNAGNGTLNDINNKLNELNLSLSSGKKNNFILDNKEKEEIILDKETYDKLFKEMLLENRIINSLEKVNITKIGDIIDFTEDDLIKIEGLGNNSLKELKKILKSYGIDLQNKYVLGDKSLDERYFYNLFDTNLSDEAKNLFKKFNIKNIGQLLEIFPDEIYKNDECCLNPKIFEIENEIKEYLKVLAIEKYPIKYSKIQRDKLNEPSLDEILELNLSEFLMQKINEFESEYIDKLDDARKIIYFERIKPEKKYTKTLEEIGNRLNVTRERIRQIEKKELSKFKIVFNEKCLVFNPIFNKLFNELGNLIYFEKNTSLNDSFGMIDEFINNSDSFNFRISFENNLINSKKYDIEDIYANIIENISELNIEVFEIKVIQEHIEQELLNYISNDNLNQKKNYEQIQNLLEINLLKKNFIKLNEFTYKLKSGTRKKSALTDKIIYFYKTLYPQGEYLYINFDKIISELKQNIPELEKYSSRALQGRILHSGELILWGKGYYIHKDCINSDWKMVDIAILDSITVFESGISEFKVEKLYYKREQDYINANIPDSRALYSLLRIKNDSRLILDEWPRICDANKGRDKRELVDIFKDYIKEKNGFVSKEEVIEYFCIDRGWKNIELELTFARAEEIIRTCDGFIHIDNLSCNFNELEKIIEITKQKIEATGNTIHLRKIKEDYCATWYSVCQKDISYDLMGLLLSKKGNLPFKIDRKVYAKPINIEENEGTQETTFVELISNWVLEQSKENKYVTNKEIYEYCDKHGFNSWNATNAVRKAGILEYYDNCFVSPEIIGYLDEMLEDLIEIAEQASKLTYERGLPYIKFELILEQFKERLPSLNDGYEWTQKLLSNVLSKINLLEVFNGAFIFKENPFNVTDLDDIAAYTIANNYPEGICTLKKLQNLLKRENIIGMDESINSNYKQELFAEGSSIELVDDGNNVRLSKIGRERYLNV